MIRATEITDSRCHSGASRKVESRLKCNTLREGIEYLQGRAERKALSRRVVVAVDEMIELLLGDQGKIGFSGQRSSQASDGILDAALLPGCVRLAEEGPHSELGAEGAVQGELGAVVEGDGAAQLAGERAEEGKQTVEDGFGSLGGLAQRAGQARDPLVGHQHGLSIGSEQHEVGFPMAGLAAGAGDLRASADGHTALNVAGGTAATAPAQPAAPGLTPRQQPVPIVLLRRAMIDEAIDRLGTDRRVLLEARQPAGDLLRRPPHRKEVADDRTQRRLARQLMARVPASSALSQHLGPRAVVMAARPGARLLTVALELPADRAGSTRQRPRNRATRLAGCMQPANRLTLSRAELFIASPHRNTTLAGCCTSGVNSGGPGRAT